MITTSPFLTFLGSASPTSAKPSPDKIQYLSVVCCNRCQLVVIPGSTRAFAMDKSGSSGVFESSVIKHFSAEK